MSNRSTRGILDWGFMFFPMMLVLGVLLHTLLAHGTLRVAELAWEVDSQAHGTIVVSASLLDQFESHAAGTLKVPAVGDASSTRARGYAEYDRKILDLELELEFEREARQYPTRGQARADRKRELRAHYDRYGSAGFVSREHLQSLPLAERLTGARGLPQLAGLLMLLWWFAMLALQGEGLDLDVQRRRHPMWEWLLSHPVAPGAVFLAEMLSPLRANPLLLAAPVFWATLLGAVQPSRGVGILQGLLVGVALAVTASCVNKAIEVVVLLRLAPRHRGAVLGLLSWLGLVASIGPIALMASPEGVRAALGYLQPLSHHLDPPFFGWMIGALPGAWSLVFAPTVALASGGLVVASAVVACSRATKRGLIGPSGAPPPATRRAATGDSSLAP